MKNRISADKLRERYPFLGKNAEIWVGEGWWDYVVEMCGEIDGLYKEAGLAPDLTVKRIHRDFGRLDVECTFDSFERRYMRLRPKVQKLVSRYSELTSRVCVICGEPRSRYQEDTDGRRPPLCFLHYEQDRSTI